MMSVIITNIKYNQYVRARKGKYHFAWQVKILLKSGRDTI